MRSVYINNCLFFISGIVLGAVAALAPFFIRSAGLQVIIAKHALLLCLYDIANASLLL